MALGGVLGRGGLRAAELTDEDGVGPELDLAAIRVGGLGAGSSASCTTDKVVTSEVDGGVVVAADHRAELVAVVEVDAERLREPGVAAWQHPLSRWSCTQLGL